METRPVLSVRLGASCFQGVPTQGSRSIAKPVWAGYEGRTEDAGSQFGYGSRYSLDMKEVQ